MCGLIGEVANIINVYKSNTIFNKLCDEIDATILAMSLSRFLLS